MYAVKIMLLLVTEDTMMFSYPLSRNNCRIYKCQAKSLGT